MSLSNSQVNKIDPALKSAAYQEWVRRCIACKKLGVNEPSFNQILEEFKNSPPGTLDPDPAAKRPEPPARRYHQYVSPIRREQA
jgi:hypothetical protein